MKSEKTENKSKKEMPLHLLFSLSKKFPTAEGENFCYPSK